MTAKQLKVENARLRAALARCAVRLGANGQRCSLCNAHARRDELLPHADDCLLSQTLDTAGC